MTIKRFIIVIFLVFKFVDCFADTGFAFGNEIEFKFYRNGTIITSQDSLAVLTNNESYSDTLFVGKGRREPEQNLLRYFDNGLYNIDGYSRIKEFKIILFLNGDRYESAFIKVFNGRNYFIFNIEDKSILRDSSPLFYVHWADYLKALILTLFLEFIITLIFFKLLKENFWNFILTLTACNLLTHPILWFICSHVNIPLFFLEFGVAIVETLILLTLFRNKIKGWKIILISLMANFISWVIGGIAMVIIAG